MLNRAIVPAVVIVVACLSAAGWHWYAARQQAAEMKRFLRIPPPRPWATAAEVQRLNPAIRSRYPAETASVVYPIIQFCGDMVRINEGSNFDLPDDYFDNRDGREVMDCTPRRIGGANAVCPPPEWSCAAPAARAKAR